MAYYCLHELHWTPSTFLQLSRAERAFVAAAVEIRVKQEEKRRKEAELHRKK